MMYDDKPEEYSNNKKSQLKYYADSLPSYDEVSSSATSASAYRGTSRGMNGRYYDESTSFNTTAYPQHPQSQSYGFPNPYGHPNLGPSSSRRYATPNFPRQPASYFPPESISPSVNITSATSYPGFTYTGRAPPRRDPFNPPPPSFSRAPPPTSRGIPYTALPTQIQIPSAKPSDLTSGFLPIFPSPHLLLAHDVQPADISRLLEDCHLI
ncbi:uncharacterized protein STEHIDRAFT_137076, partial [Stereum hirsutum FP-91666 SS1]|uniref:uncharacterized protein n=1 Tax=Stereum hirsutum (strain FP-91666) TaxID=721885 RepID=UPI000440DB83